MNDELSTTIAEWSYKGRVDPKFMFGDSLDAILNDPLQVPDEVSVHGLVESVCRRIDIHGDCVVMCLNSFQMVKVNKASYLASKRMEIPLFIELDMNEIISGDGSHSVTLYRIVNASR